MDFFLSYKLRSLYKLEKSLIKECELLKEEYYSFQQENILSIETFKSKEDQDKSRDVWILHKITNTQLKNVQSLITLERASPLLSKCFTNVKYRS